MHSIERYGVAALLLLVVTVIALLVFDDTAAGTLEPRTALAATKEPSRVAPRAAARPGEVTSPVIRRTPTRRDPTTLGAQNRGLSRERLRAERAAAEAARPREQDQRALVAGIVPASEGMEARASAREVHVLERSRPSRSSAQPEATPVASAPPARTEAARRGAERTRRYEIRPGDTLSEIAMRELGTMKRWKEILEINPGLRADHLVVGKSILLPAGSASPQPRRSKEPKPESKPKLASAETGGTYLVREGDSLWKISERLLGDGSRWKEIAKLNAKIDVDRLHPGMVLRVPAGAKARDLPASPAVAANLQTASRGRVR